MLIDGVMQAEAGARAGRVLALRSEDDCWLVLEALMVRDAAQMREQAIELLKIDILRNALYPELTQEQWHKLGWSSARNSREAARAFIRKVRAAKATGSRSGHLRVRRTPEK